MHIRFIAAIGHPGLHRNAEKGLYENDWGRVFQTAPGGTGDIEETRHRGDSR